MILLTIETPFRQAEGLTMASAFKTLVGCKGPFPPDATPVWVRSGEVNIGRFPLSEVRAMAARAPSAPVRS